MQQIQTALRQLIPTEIPNYTQDDLEYLAGVTPADLMGAAFPHEGKIRTYGTGFDARREVLAGEFAWTKSSNDGYFLLATRSPGSDETMLLRLDAEQMQSFGPALRGGADSDPREFYVRARAVPPESLMGYYPSIAQGLDALGKAHSDGPAVEKILTSIITHAQIATAALESIAGLAQKLLEMRPTDGRVKLAAATDPKRLANARKEIVHALDQRPKKSIGKPHVEP